MLMPGSLAALTLLGSLGIVPPQEPDRLYGRVTTTSGQVVEGFIRWDQNEGARPDILNASKRMPAETGRDGEALGGTHYEHCERGLHIRWGHVAWHRGCDGRETRQGDIRFGHITELEVVDRSRARVTLVSGEVLELHASSTDLGRRNRGIVVDAPNQVVELDWGDVRQIAFLAPPPNRTSTFGERLFGTLRAADGTEFTGYVTWDMDEIFGTDVLDGRSSDGKHEIKFAEIASIARGSSNSSNVTLRSGEKLRLRGSNDVDDDNRGIAVADPAIGQVTLRWDDFDVVTFTAAPAESPYRFAGARPLRGTVVTEDGSRYTGVIRWDNDEEYAWEHLDGQAGDIDFDIEFGLIRSIEKVSSRSARITVNDGRTFELSGSSDVNRDNRGIVITSNRGEKALVDWADFVRVDLDEGGR